TEELRRLEARADHRNPLAAGEGEQLRRGILPLGDDDARQIEREERLQRRPPRLRLQRVEVADLRLAEHVEAVAHEARRVAREHESRAGGFGVGDDAIEPRVARQGLELERVTLAGEQVADLDLPAHGASTLPPR